MRKIEKKFKKEFITSAVIKLFQDSNTTDETLDSEKVKKIIQDIDIASALQKLERAVAGRKILPCAKNPDMSDLEKEIQQRFSGIKFNRIINHLITARYFGYSCFEIVYNEDFSIDTLIPIPYNYVNYDNRNKIWEIKVGSNKIPLTREKFLLSIHKWNPAKAMGTSIFECCQQSFLDKSMFQRQLREISEKYGDLITLYPFDPNMEEEEKKNLKESVENMSGADAIGIPVNFDENFDLRKYVDFIKLSDLDPSIYTELEKREKEKLIQNILGSTLTMDNGGGTGSYSLGEVHKEGFDEVVEEICKFVTDSLYQLLELDALFYGYNPKDFEFILEKIYTEMDRVAQDKEKESLKGVKLDNLNKLSSTGYKLTKVALAEYLGINEKDLEEKPITNLGFGAEFSKKKIDELLENVKNQDEKFLEMLKDISIDWTKDISEQLKKSLKGINRLEDLENIEYDFINLKDKLLIAYLKGFIEDLEEYSIESSDDEFNPFKIEPDEAVKWFLDKEPSLFENLDTIQEDVNEKYFYIKHSTKLETTKALYKNLLATLKDGKTFKDWLKMSEDILNKTGFGNNPWYLEMVYRTNMMSAYNAGAAYHQELNKANKPYGLYDAIDDSRTTEICKALDGKVYPLDHDFWKYYLPPNHYSCRSKRIAVSKADIEEYGLSVSKTIPNSIKALKSEMRGFYGNQINNLKKSIETKQLEIQELKAEIEELMK